MQILISHQLNSVEDGSEFTDLSISNPDFLLHPDPDPGSITQNVELKNDLDKKC